MEYVCFWLTHASVKPVNRKIQAIENMKPPTYRKEVRMFIGVANFYRNMWARCSHMLVTLTKITSIRVTLNRTKSNKIPLTN